MKKFIEGVLFIMIVMPLLENILSIINQFTEFICTKITVCTNELKNPKTDSKKNTIGFQIPTEPIE